LERAGFTDSEITRLASDRKRAASSALIAALTNVRAGDAGSRRCAVRAVVLRVPTTQADVAALRQRNAAVVTLAKRALAAFWGTLDLPGRSGAGCVAGVHAASW
jgi:citrate lyase beta subunit